MHLQRKFKRVSLILILLVLVFGLIAPNLQYKAFAKDTEKKKAVIVVIDKVSLSELTEGNNTTIKRLLEKGAVALMNTNTAGDQNSESTYLTIGSGNRMNAPFGGLAFNPDEVFSGSTAGEIYKRRSGINAPEIGVINIGLPSIIDNNKSLSYKAVPGFLGKALHEKGLKTAVLGNADTDIEEKRQITNIAMDDTGVVDYGDVSSRMLLKDSEALMGKRTDFTKLAQEFYTLQKKADFIAIELGDTARVEAANNFALKEIVAYEKKKSISRADKFLGDILEHIDLNKDILIVVSPSPTQQGYNAKETLTPMIIAGPGIHSGVATSDTTKRLGLITNTDITSTVLHFFDIQQPAFLTGQNITSVNKANTVEFLKNEGSKIVHTASIRAYILSSYRNISMIFVILSLVALTYGYKRLKPLKMMLLAILSIPLALLLLPLLPEVGIFLSILEVIFLIIIIIWVAKILGKTDTLNYIFIISILTALALEADVLLGAPLIKASALGYDPMSGARFYGIGNEFMGVLIGALIIGLAALIQKKVSLKRASIVLVGILFIFTTYLMAAPNLGTNAGGTISAVAGLGITFCLWNNIKINKKNIILAVVAIFVVTALFIGIDLIKSSGQSHISRTIALVREGGFSEVVNIIVRKESVNINLITHTQWTWMYISNLAVILLILFKEKYRIIQVKYPIVYKGIIGIIVGSITALVFNDSGIVAAATMIPYAAVPLLLISFKERL